MTSALIIFMIIHLHKQYVCVNTYICIYIHLYVCKTEPNFSLCGLLMSQGLERAICVHKGCMPLHFVPFIVSRGSSKI